MTNPESNIFPRKHGKGDKFHNSSLKIKTREEIDN